MGMAPTIEHAAQGMRDGLLSRSQESRDFEEAWNRMRGAAIVPRRCEFNVRKVAQFVRDLVLLEAPAPQRRAMRIRLAGERYQEIAGFKLAGRDHLDLLDPDNREGALTTGWLMASQPCGLWQITPMHTAGGYSQYIEVTAFPLGAGQDGIPLLLCHLRMTGTLLQSAEAKFGFDTATDFHFIDVGAGVPDWAF